MNAGPGRFDEAAATRELIAASVQRIFADQVDRAQQDVLVAGQLPWNLWQQVSDAGFAHVLADAAVSAAEAWSNAAVVLFALGYHRVPLPLAETLVANGLSTRAGLTAPAGVTTFVDASALAARADGSQVRLSGTVVGVPWARWSAQLVLVFTGPDGPSLAMVGRTVPGLTLTEDVNLAGEPRDTLRFDAVAVHAVPFDPVPGHNAARLYGALARALSMAGAATSVLDQSVQYANDRVQFGRPIGKFQAVQHLLAEMGAEVAAGTMGAMAACAMVDSATAVLDIAIAKVRTGMMAQRVARSAHQIHGALGFTWEHSLHYGTQRLWSWRGEYGSDASWACRVGALAKAAGGARLWADLLTRSD